MDYEVIVLGSGPAGFEAARRVAEGGKRTALITVTPAGGRTTAGSLLPSKVWLHAAHHRAPESPLYSPEQTTATAAEVRAKIQSRVRETEQTLTDAGVKLISGEARIIAPGRVEITTTRVAATTDPVANTTDREKTILRADRIVVATGSEPTFAPRVKPDGDVIIAPRHTKTLSSLPESLIMVGGGITGVEYSEAFALLGARVTLVSSGDILPSFYREYADRTAEHLRALGVVIVTGERVVSVEAEAGDEARKTENGYTAADGIDGVRTDASGAVLAVAESGREFRGGMAFIATGRAADLTVFDMDETETSFSAQPMRKRITDEAGRFVPVNERGQTAIPGIFAAGDVTGPPFTANKALLQGRRAAEEILADLTTTGDAERTRSGAADDMPALIEAVYTDPQLAQIGEVPSPGAPSTDTHAETSPPGRVHLRRWSSSMLSTIHGGESDHQSGPERSRSPNGELTVWTDDDGKIRGAAAFGEGAAEVLAPIQVAINNGIRWQQLSAVPFGYPTICEVVTS